MATPTGVDTITSISRRILREEATDVYYKGSPFTWRLFKLNRVVRRGGLHIESRFVYQPWATGGAFYGPEVLNVEPSDTEISGAWDWKEYYTNVTLDQRSLIRADSEYAVANYVVEQCELAKMDLRDKIAFGIWSRRHQLQGHRRHVRGPRQRASTPPTTPACPARPTRSSSARSTRRPRHSGIGAMNTLWDNCTKGARAPTVTVSTRANLTRFENLLQAQVQYTQPTAVVDQTFASGGFSGGWYRNQPWMVDEHMLQRPELADEPLVLRQRELLRAHHQPER